ncbi:MAG: hypothetical protein ACFB3T_13690 [Geminicoccaceae bacterium]
MPEPPPPPFLVVDALGVLRGGGGGGEPTFLLTVAAAAFAGLPPPAGRTGWPPEAPGAPGLEGDGAVPAGLPAEAAAAVAPDTLLGPDG